jgi:hypothetical protein
MAGRQTSSRTANSQRMKEIDLDKNSTSYKAGHAAFNDGMLLADRPNELLMDWGAWQTGWLDALAEAVRSLVKK